MYNLEQLTLYVSIENRTRFVDGFELENEILIHMPRLHTFIFYIKTQIEVDDSVLELSNEDIQRTFNNVRFSQVGCIAQYCFDEAVCHVFSLPFTSDRLEVIGNKFPNIIFRNVTFLYVLDLIRFKHEFFVRIAGSFPSLKFLRIINFESQLSDSDDLEFHTSQSYSIVEYPHLTSLDIRFVHIDYVEQFLDESKTRLPHLTELHIEYDQLKTVTENFTRDATRLICSQVKRLIIKEVVVYPKDFYLYFPLL